jgi:hypothetical protein
MKAMLKQTDAAPAKSKSLRPARGLVLSVAMTVILLASAALIAKQLLSQVEVVHEQVRALRFSRLVLPLLATLAAILIDTLCFHRAIAACTGGRSGLRLAESFAVLNASTLGKYLPGKVWGYGLQAHVLRERGVPVTTTIHANVTIMASALTAAGWLMALGALWLPHRAAGVLFAATLAALLTGLHFFYGPFFGWLAAFARARFGWDLRIEPVPRRSYLVLVFYYVANLLLLGAAAAFVLAELDGALSVAQFVAVTIVTAVSWLVGYAAFFVPAGLGVREVAMIALLGQLGIAGSVVLVPLVTRLLLVAGEALFGGLGILALWHLARRRRGVVASPPP